MKILVIFTGGTIGSAVSDGWISPSEDMKYLLLERYAEKTGDKSEFDTMTPYTVLSENLCAENINKLSAAVTDNIDAYDGIIVTHGTDTLQYSAAALAYSLGSSCKPVVLVSSNYPLGDSRANGLDNFIAAVEFIKSESGRGVFVSYRNSGESTCIHLATRLALHTECFDEVYSIDKQPYAVYDGEIRLNAECTGEEITPCGSLKLCESPMVLSVQAMPGDNFCYDISKYKAVIFRPYHSGTLNTSCEKFREFCLRLKESNIRAFVTDMHGGITYESVSEYENLGLTVLPMCSFVSFYMKLWIDISES